MNVFPLRADTYTVANRCYRRNPYRPQAAKQPDSTDYGDTPDLYGDEPDVSCKFNSSDERQLKINNGVSGDKRDTKGKANVDKKQPNEKTAYKTEDERILVYDNKWTSEMYVPQAFLGKLIGVKGSTRMDIEKSTSCRLKIPRNPGENLVVTSFSGLESVQICLDRVEDLLLSFRQTTHYSHFVSYPLQDSSELQTSFAKFKEAVLASPNIPEATRNPNLFIKSQRLHCTISMLRLLDDRDAEAAKKIIREALDDLKMNQPIEVEVRGLSLFNDDPSETMVVFANVEHPQFQKLADCINRKLIGATLAFPSPGNDSSQSVVIHMTLMNSKYAAQAAATYNRRAFDATALLDEFGCYNFGKAVVDKATKKQFYYKFIHFQVVINCFSDDSKGGYKVFHETSFHER
ncbi:unnamed protein product [Auanema sp. JU1783]|nr:unnamed protein product [Auanema sp. JU1783]